MTPRTRKQRKESHPQLAPGTRHNAHTTPHVEYDEGCPVGAAIKSGGYWDGGTCPQCGATSTQEACFRYSDPQPEAGDRVAPLENVALADHRRQDENEDKSRGAAHALRGVPGLDRQALVAPKDHRPQARDASSSHRAPRLVALHPLEGGKLDGRRGTVLRWAADVLRLGWTRHRRVLALAGPADASSRDRLRKVGLFDRVARGAVAEYLAALPRTGSLRFW